MLANAKPTDFAGQFASDVIAGLTRPGQKTLPSKYLYDEVGSRLFDVITALPEYGVTRAEERLLERHAAEMTERFPCPMMIAELGSGSGQKTRHILEQAARRQPQQRTRYYPIEISATALDLCDRELSDLELVEIEGIEAEYLDGLAMAVARRRAGENVAVLFLGSTLGNLNRPAAERFLRSVHTLLRSGDALLLGTDLIKDEEVLLGAYDDAIGVTAAFDLNVLARINRELGGDFDIRRFAHEARFNRETGSVEMHLRSLGRQRVWIAKADLQVDFAAGETIWTESSHKYTEQEVRELAASSCFRLEASWVDREWGFAENLLIAI